MNDRKETLFPLFSDNFNVIPLAIDSGNLDIKRNNNHSPALGYFCRINSQNGFDKLVDAFIYLKKENIIPDLTFHVTGGFTGDDKPFISEQIKKIKQSGLKSFVRIYPEFQGNSKEEFFGNIDIMSVPVRKHDGYGLYILEANAAGIPVVQPDTGAFKEIIEMTKGGVTYSPDSVEDLSAALIKLFSDDKLRLNLGEMGKENVNKKLSLEKMAEGLSMVYNELVNK